MLDEEEIREQGLTQEDVLDRETVQPDTEPSWLEVWDENPDSRPGENLTLEDGVLSWEYKGFGVELTGAGDGPRRGFWRIRLDVPEEVGAHFYDELATKCHERPEHGFIESAEIEGYVCQSVTAVVQDNHQATWEANKLVESMIESAERTQEFADEMQSKLDAARENE